METKKENEKSSKKVKKGAKPSWIKTKPEEMERIIIELANKGETLSGIGMILRDEHGIPKAKLVGGRDIKDILIDKGVSFKSERDIINQKIKVLREHATKGKHDHCASRALTKKLWVLHRLQKNES